MSKVVTVTSGGNYSNTDWDKYTEVPEDFYRARVDRLEFRPNMKTNYGEKDRWQWHFEIIEEGEFDGVMVTGLTSTSMNQKSGLRKWLKGFYRKLQDGEQIDLDDLVGRICTIYVQHGSEKDDGSHYCNVINLMRDKEKEEPLLEPLTQKEAKARIDSADGEVEADTKVDVKKPQSKKKASQKKRTMKRTARKEADTEEELEGIEW